MIRRGLFDLGNGIVRVTRPGVDIDEAGPLDYLLHENDLYSQPYFSQYVTWNWANDSSLTPRTETVPVSIPDVTIDPICIIYIKYRDGINFFPGSFTVNTSPGRVSWSMASSTQINITFYKYNNPWGPEGCYVTLLRRPEI